MKFLVVDDSKLARLSLIKVLKNSVQDPEVEQAENGAVAVEIATTFQPDVVFLDLTMPVLNGYEALPKILEVSSRSKVIVVSADVQEQAKERVISLGAQLHVQKPINQEKMEDILSLI